MSGVLSLCPNDKQIAFHFWGEDMQTLKEVLRRDQERQNLQNVGLCVLAVIVLTVGAFVLAQFKPMAPAWVDETVAEINR